jgi:hypothetical protein
MFRTKRFRMVLAGAAFLTATFVHGGEIRYQAVDLADTTAGKDLWQYQYLVSGFPFPTNAGFDILFLTADGYQVGDLQKPPNPNANWDVISVQPDLALGEPGLLDAWALIDNASTADRFLIDFIWRGAGTPGSQPFEIFDSALQVVDRGTTTSSVAAAPEPATGLLLLAGLGAALGLRRKRPG